MRRIRRFLPLLLLFSALCFPADTQRKLSDLQALFPSGVPGAISAQDIRDFVVSVYPTEFNVKNYGAKGDGVTNDKVVIQAALDAANAAGGGVVFFPPGTYLVSISGGVRALQIYPKVVLQGSGINVSTIKLAANQGSYENILFPAAFGTDVSGFAMYDLTIDQNTTNNSGTPTSPTNVRSILKIGVGSGLQVRRCRFTDVDSINTIILNSTGLFDSWVTDNIFDDVGGPTNHDHSTIYFDGNRGIISNNIFLGQTPVINGSPKTSIETHGGQVVVSGNIVKDYVRGMNITGTSQLSPNVSVYGNVMQGVQIGIQLWSYTGGTLENISVVGNVIRLSHSTWNDVTRGILIDPNSTAKVLNCVIANNAIEFVGALGTVSASDNDGGAIEWRRNDTSVVDQNLQIIGNVIDGALANGIRAASSVRGLRVSGNLIRNPGLSTGGFANDFRSGILLSGVTMQDVVVSGNVIVDDQGVSTIKFGIRNASTTFTNGHILDNTLRVGDGAAIPDYSPNSTQAAEVRHAGPFVIFSSGDTSPSVSGGLKFKTANGGGTVVSAFDNGYLGQEIYVFVNDANTTIDFTGTTLKGNAGADWVPANGDHMRCVKDTTNWYCQVTDSTP